jgi:hypothetical protein
MNKIKLVGISMIFYYTKLHLTNCNGPWVFSIKQNMNFNFQPAATFIFVVFDKKMVLLKVVHPLKIYQHTKFHGPTLTDATFASTSEVWTRAILKCLKVRDWNVWYRGHPQWHDLRTEFHKNLPIGSKVIRGETQTDRQTYRLVIS